MEVRHKLGRGLLPENLRECAIDSLANAYEIRLVPGDGVEPATRGFSVPYDHFIAAPLIHALP